MWYVEKQDGTDVQMTKDEFNKNIEEDKIVFRGISSAQGDKYMIAFLKQTINGDIKKFVNMEENKNEE